MKKFLHKISAVMLVVAVIFSFSACNPEVSPTPTQTASATSEPTATPDSRIPEISKVTSYAAGYLEQLADGYIVLENGAVRFNSDAWDKFLDYSQGRYKDLIFSEKPATKAVTVKLAYFDTQNGKSTLTAEATLQFDGEKYTYSENGKSDISYSRLLRYDVTENGTTRARYALMDTKITYSEFVSGNAACKEIYSAVLPQLIPTSVDAEGGLNALYYIPNRENTYRYVYNSTDTDNVTKGEFILAYEGKDNYNHKTTHRIYEIEESPDRFRLLQETTTEGYNQPPRLSVIFYRAPRKDSEARADEIANGGFINIFDYDDTDLEAWNNFYEKTTHNTPAEFKTVNYYDASNVNLLYKEMYDDDYPHSICRTTIFTGEEYVYICDDDEVKTYKYLMAYEHSFGDETSIYYTLVNDNTLTYQEIWESLIFSASPDFHIDHETIFTKKIS